MCVIICLGPDQTIPQYNLENACYNNWHSYGLVTLEACESDEVTHKMEITRVVPESGEVDPDEVRDLLEKNKHLMRFLHLRHTTAGATTLENTHPFDVYTDEDGKKVVFMHNGTMSEYKSMKYEGSNLVADDTGPSDTKNYVDQILIPYTDTDYGSGFGDISDPLYVKLMKKFWPYSNRGLLISNADAPLFLGEWKDVKFGDEKITVSNDDYFYSVKRGPEYTRRLVREEQAKQKAKEEAAKSRGEVVHVPTQRKFDNPYTLLKDVVQNIKSKHSFYRLKNSVCDILNDWDVWDRDCAAQSLVGMTKDDMREMVNKVPEDFIALTDWIFMDYADLYDEHKKVQDKLDKATKHIASMAEELKKKGAA